MTWNRLRVVLLLLLATSTTARAADPDPSLLTLDRIITADDFRRRFRAGAMAR